MKEPIETLAHDPGTTSLGWQAIHLARSRHWDAERIASELDLAPADVRAAMRGTLLGLLR